MGVLFQDDFTFLSKVGVQKLIISNRMKIISASKDVHKEAFKVFFLNADGCFSDL